MILSRPKFFIFDAYWYLHETSVENLDKRI